MQMPNHLTIYQSTTFSYPVSQDMEIVFLKTTFIFDLNS